MSDYKKLVLQLTIVSEKEFTVTVDNSHRTIETSTGLHC